MSATNETIGVILARLDALERANDTLQADNRALRAEVAELKLADPRPPLPLASAFESGDQGLVSTGQPVNRRRVLQRGVQVAAAAVVAGVLAEHATPDASATETVGEETFVNVYAQYVEVINASGNTALYTRTTSSAPVMNASNEGSGSGVSATSASLDGTLIGYNTNPDGTGVAGSGGRYGMFGDSSHSDGSGVYGSNDANVGVLGQGKVGVKGTSSTVNYTAVVGEHTGTVGYGVLGVGTGSGVGVIGRNASGEAVRGEGKVGLRATSTASGGYGAVIEGGKAQLRLVPSTTVGKPTSGSHLKGELVVDKNCNVYLCTVAGTPGTWRKVSTTAS